MQKNLLHNVKHTIHNAILDVLAYYTPTTYVHVHYFLHIHVHCIYNTEEAAVKKRLELDDIKRQVHVHVLILNVHVLHMYWSWIVLGIGRPG